MCAKVAMDFDQPSPEVGIKYDESDFKGVEDAHQHKKSVVGMFEYSK